MAGTGTSTTGSRQQLYTLVTSSPSSAYDSLSSASSSSQLYSGTSTSEFKSETSTSSSSTSTRRSCLGLSLTMPTKSRFLADFTLGFADGLTVPFALTAGLSSLGRTDTVLYAGAAEICAGSISMGIGGYLSARGEGVAEETAADDAASRGGGGGEYDVDEEKEALRRDADAEKGSGSGAAVEVGGVSAAAGTVAEYLRPLDLPPALFDGVASHVRSRPGVLEALLAAMAERRAEGEDEDAPPSPVMSGLSVALGYLVGGLLPLFPYFIVDKVGDGLVWSFVVCLVALFAFGFAKDFVLTRQRRREVAARVPGGLLGTKKGGLVGGVRWRDVRHSVLEGLQMVILGGVAALAAVLCVRAFEGLRAVPSDVSSS